MAAEASAAWTVGIHLLHGHEAALLVHEPGVEVGLDELGVAQHPLVKRDVGLDAADLVLAQGPLEAPYGLRAVLAPDDELGDHGIVVDGNLRALVDAAVIADAESLGQPQSLDLSRARHEVGLRVLGADAAFDGVAGGRG